MKKLLSLVLSFLLLASLCPALADTPPADQIAASGSSYVEWYNKTRIQADLIGYTQAGIDAETGAVIVIGKTETYEAMDIIGVTFIVQQWKSSQWNDYYTHSYTNYAADAISAVRAVEVESGRYYRVLVIHKAYKDDLSDLLLSTTSSVYVN